MFKCKGVDWRAQRRRGCLGLWLACAAAAASGDPGRFHAPQVLPLQTPNAINNIAIGDIDGDGDGDLFVAYGHLPAADGIAQVPQRDRLLINQGAAGFLESTMPLDSAAPRPSTDVRLVDLDGDGDLDAVVASGGYYNGSMIVGSASRMYRNEAGVFGAPLNFGTSEPAVGVAAADIDGDGDLDIAIARNTSLPFFPGVVDVYRNDSSPSGLALTLLQRMPVSGSAVAGLRFARNGEGQPPLLLVLFTVEGVAGFPPGVLVLRRQNASGQYGQGQLLPKPTGNLTGSPRLRAFDVGDFDSDGRDDLVMALSVDQPTGIGRSRVYRATGTGAPPTQPDFVDIFQDFAWASDTAVRMFDVNADGRADLVFGNEGVAECTQTAPGSLDELNRTEFCTGSALNVVLSNGTGFVHSGQCFGSRATLFVGGGRVDADPFTDLLVVRGSGTTLGGGPLAATFMRLDNDGPPGGSSNCCAAEQAATYGEIASEPGLTPRQALAASPRVDLVAFAQVRQRLMPDSPDGIRLLARYNQHSDEVAAAMRDDPALWWAATVVLVRWSTPVRSLIDGGGDGEFIDAPMIEAVESFLVRATAVASPPLASAIAEERARLPPFGTFIGMSLSQFSGIALPSDLLFRNGFESTP